MKPYETQEIHRALAALRDVESKPLQDRRESAQAWARALVSPGLVAERVAWLLDGNFGYGQMILAQRIAMNPRCNVAAGLGLLIAAFEWGCPNDRSRKAWKALSPTQQEEVNSSILAAVASWKAEG